MNATWYKIRNLSNDEGDDKDEGNNKGNDEDESGDSKGESGWDVSVGVGITGVLSMIKASNAVDMTESNLSTTEAVSMMEGNMRRLNVTENGITWTSVKWAESDERQWGGSDNS